MPDPAEVIAATLLRPPDRPDAGILPPVTQEDTENGLQWSYRAAMAHPAAPDLALHIASTAIQALGAAGWVIVPAAAPSVPSSGALPSPEQMRSWLTCHQWKAGEQGSFATMWYPPVRGRGVIIPDGGTGPEIHGAIERIAARQAMSPEQVLAEMLTYE